MIRKDYIKSFLSSCFFLSIVNSLVGFIYTFCLIRICSQSLTISESASFLVLFTSLGLLKNSDLCKLDYFFSNLIRNSSIDIKDEITSGFSGQSYMINSIVIKAVRYSYSKPYTYLFILSISSLSIISFFFLFSRSDNTLFVLSSTIFILLYHLTDSLVRPFVLACEFVLKLRYALVIQIALKSILLVLLVVGIILQQYLLFTLSSSSFLLLIFFIILIFLFSNRLRATQLSVPQILKNPPTLLNRSHFQLYLPILLGFVNAQCDAPLALALLDPQSANNLFYAYTISKTISVPSRSLILPLRSNFSHLLHGSDYISALHFLQKNMFLSFALSSLLFALISSLFYLTPMTYFLSPPPFLLTFIIAISELTAGIFYPAIDCLIFSGSYKLSRFLLFIPAINIILSIILGSFFGENGIAIATLLPVCLVTIPTYRMGAKALS